MRVKVLAFITGLLLIGLGLSADTVVIQAGKVFSEDGSYLENIQILIKEGRIVEMSRNPVIPEQVKIYDFKDCTVYPGLFNLFSSLGLSDIGAVRVWNDSSEVGDFKPHIKAYRAFYSWNRLLPITRDFGTLMVLAVPTGGLVSGKAALYKMSGWTHDDMALKKEAALIVNIPESPVGRRKTKDQSGKTSKKLKELLTYFDHAAKYWEKKKKNVNVPYHLQFEEMLDVFESKLPVIFSVNKGEGIKSAIKLAKKYQIKAILYGLYEGEKVIKEIKESGYPVILPSMYAANRKWDDGVDKVFRLPGKLSKAGIRFAFSTSGSATAFDLPIQAGRACAYGLSQKEAIKALTQYPAQFFGMEEYGILKKGKSASLIIADGNILETSTRIKAVFIDGKKVAGGNYFNNQFIESRDKKSGGY